MIRNAAQSTFRASYIIAGALLILLAVLTVCASFVLPVLVGQKASVEARVSEYLKSPVEIGEISVRWKGFGPMLRAQRVSVLEIAERSVTLDELLIDINLVKSLLLGIPIINELSLVGASLAVEADMDGQYRIHGLESVGIAPATADGITPEPGERGVDIIAWLFNARKVALLDTQLTLIDMANDHTLVIENLNVRVENFAQVHHVRVDAQLPESLGGRLEAGLDVAGKGSALSESDGSLYFAADSVSLEGLMKLLRLGGIVSTDLVQSLNVGAAASTEIWGRWQDGQLISASGPLNISKVVDPLSGDTLLDSASAQLQFTRSEVSTDISATQVQASMGSSRLLIERLKASRSATVLQAEAHEQTQNIDSDSGVLSGEDASVLNDSKPQTAAWHFSGAASQIPADMVVSVRTIASLALQFEVLQMLEDVAADGQVNNLSFDVSGSSDEPLITASMDVNKLTLEGGQHLPSFGPLSGELSMVNSAGQLSLVADSMPLSWPVASDVSLQVDSLDTTIDIDLRNPDRTTFSAKVKLSDEGIDTSTRARLTLMPGLSPHLDLQSRFDVADITAIKLWLPSKLMKPAATNWIDRAINGGSGADGSLLFFGHLDEFPFDDGQGVFTGDVDIRNGALAFLPDWPEATDINGSLQLNGLRLAGLTQNSTLDKFSVSKLGVTIANLTAPTLEMSLTASGGFQEVVDFGVNGPLTDILKPAVGDMTGNGVVQMDLSLEASLFEQPSGNDEGPLASAWRPLSVNGSVFLDNNNVNFERAGLTLDNAHGAVGFNERGIAINSLQGKVLGHDVQLTGKSVGQGENADTIITITGVMEANDLLAHYGNPLDQFIRGASRWRATLTAPHSSQRVADEGVGLSVSSDLVGAQLRLPAPFNKGSSAPVDFTISTAFREGAAQQQWDAVYGNELQARVTLVDDALQSLLVVLGQGEMADASQPDSLEGIRLQGTVPSLAADAWIETVARYIDSLPAGDEEKQPILPVSAELDTDALILGRTNFGKATMRTDTDETYLNIVVSNPSLKGSLLYPREYWTKETALKAHLEILDWSVIDALGDDTETVAGSAGATDALDPRLFPPVEARVSVFRRDNVRVRDLVLRAEPNVSGLDITTLGFAYDTMRLVGQGYWYLQDPQSVSTELVGKHTSRLNMVLQSDDFGVGFDEIGLSGIIDDAQGSIEMQLNWPGALYKPEIPQLDGEVAIDLEAGSIVPLEPAAGRVIGLFALQALPRRLNLDFKDLTGDGLAFTSITGTAVIDDGIAQVPLLQLKGPVGVVDIIGSSNLDTQQFNQRITVLPRVSAALPVIGAISAGATGGIGAIVATGVLKALGVDFDRLGLRTYQLTGSWTEPKFTPVASEPLGHR